MGAGLRHLVEIGRYTEGRNEWGEPLPEPVWQRIAIVWAAVEALSGRTFFEAQQSLIQADHRVTIRWRPDVQPGYFVRFDGKEMKIQAVLDLEGRRRWLELVCQLLVPT